MGFEDSVLDHADHNGNLSTADAHQLLKEHGCSLSDMDDASERNAEALLAWLGY